jgi:beta-lactam-binding protein with PASTA domain
MVGELHAGNSWPKKFCRPLRRLGAESLGQAVLGWPPEGRPAPVRAFCGKLARKRGSGARLAPQRTSRWPLAGLAVLALLMTACSTTSSPGSAVSSSASAHPLGSASSSNTASPTPSSSGEVKPVSHKSPSGQAATGAVPNTLGKSFAQAKSAIFSAGFHKYAWVYGCYGATIGQVVKQVPAAGTQVVLTTRVKFFLQAGNCPAAVPNTLGTSLPQARSALSGAGFDKYSWLYGCYNSPNIGEVVKQVPVAGTRVPVTTHVNIYLQANNCPTSVPNVIGMDQSAAVSTVEQAGFRVHWTYECLGSSTLGVVVTQSPAAGTSYARGNTVSIQLQATNCTPSPSPSA